MDEHFFKDIITTLLKKAAQIFGQPFLMKRKEKIIDKTKAWIREIQVDL